MYDQFEIDGMDRQELINLYEWQQVGNWSWWGYRSARDTRLFVPRQNPALGWTLNFAHRGAWWSLFGLSSVPIGLIVFLVTWRLIK